MDLKELLIFFRDTTLPVFLSVVFIVILLMVLQKLWNGFREDLQKLIGSFQELLILTKERDSKLENLLMRVEQSVNALEKVLELTLIVAKRNNPEALLAEDPERNKEKGG
jgi:ABC-type lipoprotein release transport system permease subunit